MPTGTEEAAKAKAKAKADAEAEAWKGVTEATKEVLRARDDANNHIKREANASTAQDNAAAKQEASMKAESNRRETMQHFVKKLDELGTNKMMQSYDVSMRHLLDLCIAFAIALNARHHSQYGYPLDPELALVQAAAALTSSVVGGSYEVVKGTFGAVELTGELVSAPVKALYGYATGNRSENLIPKTQQGVSNAYHVIADTSIGKLLLPRSVELSREMMNQSTCDENGIIQFKSVKELFPGEDKTVIKAFDTCVQKTQAALLTHAGYRQENPHAAWTRESGPLSTDALKTINSGNLSKYGVKLTNDLVSLDGTRPKSGP